MIYFIWYYSFISSETSQQFLRITKWRERRKIYRHLKFFVGKSFGILLRIGLDELCCTIFVMKNILDSIFCKTYIIFLVEYEFFPDFLKNMKLLVKLSWYLRIRIWDLLKVCKSWYEYVKNSEKTTIFSKNENFRWSNSVE